MTLPIPNLDDRRFADLVREARGWIIAHSPTWTDFNASDPGMTLVDVMAWLTDLTLYRVNRIPERSFITFLDLMGIRLRPAEAARTWLVFEPRIVSLDTMDSKAAVLPIIKPDTVAQARREDGPPVEFSTLEPLQLTRSRPLVVVFSEGGQEPVKIGAADPARAGSLLETLTNGRRAMPLAPKQEPASHLLFLGRRNADALTQARALGKDDVITAAIAGGLLHLEVELSKPLDIATVVQWERSSGQAQAGLDDPLHASWRFWNPERDGTEGLRRSGRITFSLTEPLFARRFNTDTIVLRGTLRRAPPGQGLELRQIGYRFELPQTAAQPPSRIYSRSPQSLFTELRVPQPIAAGVESVIELSRPFGTDPVPEMALLIESPLFRRRGAQITVSFTIRNEGVPPDAPMHELRWEMRGEDDSWILLGRSTPAGVRVPVDEATPSPRFIDNTNGLTQSGTVIFQRPDAVAQFPVLGEQGWFLRIRLVTGIPHRIVLTDIRISFADPLTPFDLVLAETYGEVRTLDHQLALGNAVIPFEVHRNEDARPSLHIGFSTAPAIGLNRLFLDLQPAPETSLTQSEQSGFRRFFPDQPAVPEDIIWSYSGKGGWQTLPISHDSTRKLTTRGTIGFVAQDDWTTAAASLGDSHWLSAVGDLHWLRAQLNPLLPLDNRASLAAVATNTVEAWNAVPVLGTSIVAQTTGQAWNRIRLPDPSILGGLVLAIRELDDPSEDALATLRADPGVTLITDPSPNAQRAPWVQWQEVENFFHSDGKSRHYVVDYVEGTITFGDGRHGRIPPPGANRIKLVSSQRGGGVSGNVPAFAINQLRIRPESVDRVFNPVAAEGGMDAEPLRDARERGPYVLRHRERAVTADDYERLAREASRSVARAHCVVVDGVVNVLIVPSGVRSSAADEVLRAPAAAPSTAIPDAPYPGLHLIETVQDYLDQRRTVGVRVRVSGPDYLAMIVEMDVMLKPAYLARMHEVRQRIENALRRFVHPVLGGPDVASRGRQGRNVRAQDNETIGWPLGRALHLSEIYYVVEQIREVDYAENVQLRIAGETGFRDRIGLRKNAFPHFHRITVHQAR